VKSLCRLNQSTTIHNLNYSDRSILHHLSQLPHNFRKAFLSSVEFPIGFALVWNHLSIRRISRQYGFVVWICCWKTRSLCSLGFQQQQNQNTSGKTSSSQFKCLLSRNWRFVETNAGFTPHTLVLSFYNYFLPKYFPTKIKIDARLSFDKHSPSTRPGNPRVF